MKLEIREISKAFDQGHRMIFDHLSVTFPEKGMVGICGQSGKGKSTLLNIISGLVDVDDGGVYIDGHNIKDIKKDQLLNNNFCYLYQNANLIDCLTVKENIELFCKIKEKSYSHDLFQYYLKIFQIDHLLSRKVHEISGGQRQRVALLRTLLTQCPILLCDEPTGALNKENAKIVMEALKKYSQHHLVIIVSHDQQLMNQYCHDIINLDQSLKVYSFCQETPFYYSSYLRKSSRYIDYHYALKMLYYEKKKMMLMVLGQVVSLVVSILLIAGSYGAIDYYQGLFDHSPIQYMNMIESNDHSSINPQDLDTLIKKHSDTFYDLSRGIIKGHKQVSFYQITSQQAKKYHLQENELLVNKAFIKNNKSSLITYRLNHRSFYFQFKVMKDEDIIHQSAVYYCPNLINQNILIQIKQRDQRIVEDRHYQRLLDLNQKTYTFYNEVQEIMRGYQSIYTLACVVISLFIIVAIVISFILIYLLYHAILILHLRDFAIYLCCGVPCSNITKMLNSQGMMIAVIIVLLSQVISLIMMKIANGISLGKMIINVPFYFQLPVLFDSSNDLFYVLVCGYILLILMVIKKLSRKLEKLDLILLLKEN